MRSDEIRSSSTIETATASIETPPEPGTPVAHDWEDPDSLLLKIVETVADETDTRQDELAPLHSVLDVDALERLLTGDGSPLRLTFSYEGCTIVASNDGTVVVHPT